MLTRPEGREQRDVSPCSLATRLYVQQWGVLLIRDGVLYKHCVSADGLREINQLVLPHSHRKPLIQTVHGHGDFGVKRTCELIPGRAYCVGWQSDVKLELARIDKCAQYFRRTSLSQAGLQPQLSGTPWAKVLSTLRENIPSRATVISISSLLWISSPNGRRHFRFMIKDGFESELVTQLCNALGIQKIRSCPYRPATNGALEMFHRTLH